ncbi:MAG: DUF5723 family protein [Bacteroidota bacterium]
MIRRLKYIMIILLAAVMYDSSAQNSQVLYHMNLPQRHMLNPALRPTNSVYIGLPVLSGINLNINNNFFNFSDLLLQSGDSLITVLHPDFPIEDFIAKIKDVNAIEPQVLVQLFGLGFNAGKDLYIFLDINERVEANIALPGDLLRLALQGNEPFIGSKVDLSSLRTNVMVYHEAGIGFSKNITNNLRIGVKGKLLMGMAAVSTDVRSFGITVNDDYSHIFDADMTVNLSAPISVDLDTDGYIDNFVFDDTRFDDRAEIIKYALSTENLGVGLDAGAEYTFGDRFRVSAAITDLGMIRWKRDVTNLNTESSFNFTGIDLMDMYNREIDPDSLAAELLDSLMNSFSATSDETPFTTYLPFNLTAGASFNLTKNFSLGVLSHTRFIGKQIKEALTLSANINLGNALSTTLAYTAANHRYDNLGFGLAVRGGCFQIYFMADRIPLPVNLIKSDDIEIPEFLSSIWKEPAIPVPDSFNTIHLRLGMNLAFGNRIKKKNDKPMLVIPEPMKVR